MTRMNWDVELTEENKRKVISIKHIADTKAYVMDIPLCYHCESSVELWVMLDKVYKIFCSKCGVSGPTCSSPNDAIRYWEERSNE